MLQRVNSLVPNKLQNINRRIHPSEQQKKRVFRLLRQPLKDESPLRMQLPEFLNPFIKKTDIFFHIGFKSNRRNEFLAVIIH
jgi:hypothetical protein